MKTHNTITLSQPVFYILLVLSIQPSHGYEIMKKVHQFSGKRITLGPGTLYGALKRLLDEELIEENENEAVRRRYYKISDTGAALVAEELNRYADALSFAKKNLLMDLFNTNAV